MAGINPTHVGGYRALCTAILARLPTKTIPALLKPAATAFRAQANGYEAACEAVDVAEKARNQALKEVGDADDKLDASIDELAYEVLKAKLGSRISPFASFYSKYGVSVLKSLPYAEEPDEVDALVEALLETKPAKEVVTAAGVCTGCGEAVRAALDAFTPMATAYSEALSARDQLLPALTKSLSTLRKAASLAWDDDPGKVKALFAPPEKVVAPMKQAAKKAQKTRAAKKASGATSGVPGAPTPIATTEKRAPKRRPRRR